MVKSEKLVLLENIPLILNSAKIIERMHAHGDVKRYEKNINELIELVTPVAKPKAMYKIACVDHKGTDFLEIDGVKFFSRLVIDKLGQAESVFVCATTCGTEVEAIEIPNGDVMKRFCFDAIKNAILFSASAYLREHLIRRYHLKQVSTLNPGETQSFTAKELKNLFAILGDVEGTIGVKLTENCALVPTKSGCGIYFSTENEFVSCRLCPQQRCQGRRAPYEPDLARQYPSQTKNNSVQLGDN